MRERERDRRGRKVRELELQREKRGEREGGFKGGKRELQ